MKIKRVKYSDLSAKQKEIYNFQKIAGILADYGFNCIKLADDWQGADFLAYHKDGKQTLKVQLKGRLCVDKKYLGKDLFMAFQISKTKKTWYLIEHDKLVKAVSETTNWLNTDSWKERGIYNSSRPNERLLSAIAHAALFDTS